LLRLLYNLRMYRSILYWGRWKYQYPTSVHEMSASFSVGGIGMHAPSLRGRDGRPAFMARLQFGHTTHQEVYIYTSFSDEAAHYPSSVKDTLHLMLHCSCKTMQQSVKVHLPERHQKANLIHPILESPFTIPVINPACT